MAAFGSSSKFAKKSYEDLTYVRVTYNKPLKYQTEQGANDMVMSQFMLSLKSDIFLDSLTEVEGVFYEERWISTTLN